MAKPTVEGTLNATMAEIRKGAAPWKIKDALLAQLKVHYRPEFKANLANWPRVKGKILRLARFQGAIAALLAESAQPEKSAAAQVGGKALWTASWIVQIGCPPDAWFSAQARGGFRTFGKNCKTVPANRIDLDLLKRLGSQLQEVTPTEKVGAVAAAFASSAVAVKARVA